MPWCSARFILRLAGAVAGFAQESQDQGQDLAQPMTLDRTLATLHGVVRNAATGEGLPRALVRVEGDANTGALTDGEGRFEIANIPVGPQEVEVRKPGFLDRGTFRRRMRRTRRGRCDSAMPAVATTSWWPPQMPDVIFTLAPTGAIRGQVELSTGEPAEGIAVNAGAADDSGRARRLAAGRHRQRPASDGTFRFGGLVDGDYALFSEPAMDSDLDGAPGGAGQRMGLSRAFIIPTRASLRERAEFTLQTARRRRPT